MLIGSFQHNIDPKGRLFIPAKWREDLGANFVITKGAEQCLIAMSMEEWDKISAKIALIPIADRAGQMFVRHFMQWASDCTLDKQGRILISQKLRTFAQLEGELTLIGLNKRIEIWNNDILNKLENDMAGDYNEIMQKAAEWGI